MKPQSILISSTSKSSSTLILVSIFINIFTLVYATSKLDHYQSLLCADLQCQEQISDGITTSIYPSPEKILLSFKKNSNVKIFGKTGDKHFYFVEVNKKRGFVPAKLIKETNIHLEETKLNDVKFDFKGFERNLTSKFQSKSELNQTNNNDTIDVSLSSSDQQIPDDQLSSTATPFVYSQKITVIDGTTIAEDLLVTTATPSPTFVESPVTKTATIEANFTDNFVELDKETVTQKENELSKERGSLYKQLVKPIVVPPPPAIVVDNNQNDVIVESEDSSEQEIYVDNQIDVNVADGDGANTGSTSNNDEIVEEKNNNSVDDVSNEDVDVLQQKQQNVTNTNVDVNDSSQADGKQPIENIEIQTNITSEILQPVQEESVQQVNNHDNGVFDENVQQNNSTILTENVNVDSSDHVDEADVDIPDADLSVNEEEQNVLISQNNNSIDVIDSNAVETGEKSNIEENINDNNLNPNAINADIATNQNLDSSSSHQIDKRSTIGIDENVVLSQQHKSLVADAASVAEPILDNHSKLSEDKIDDLSKSAYQQHQQQQPPQLPPLQKAETIPSPSILSHVNVVNNADLTPSSATPQQPSLNNVQQPHHHQQQQQQPHNTLPNTQTLSENSPNHQHHLHHHHQYIHNEIPTQVPPQNFENININVVPPHLSQQQKHQQYIENTNVNNVPSPQAFHQSHPSPQQPTAQPIKQEFVPNSKENPIPSESILINTHHHHHHHHQPQQQQQVQQLHQQQQQQHISDSSFIPPLRNDNYQNQENIVAANNNIAKRRFLAERVGFVSVIMEIIPDEVELFFESFNISLHAIICTSIVAFFWCMMKILIFFISSSKKVRELRDVICQVQRKLYYFETEKEKIEQKYNNCRGESSSYQDNLNKIEKRRYQLEQDNEKLKNEINILKNENITLKSQAQNNPQINAKLNSVSMELEKWKQENSQLNLKIKKLEEQIESHLLTIKNQEKAAELDKEEIDNLNEQLEQLNEEIQKLNEIIKESEQKFNLVQLENTNLKELQNKLNEEIKEMKDDILSAQEKAEKFEKQSILLEQQLKVADEKIKTQMEELEKKNVEIQSMQTLLSKLNKNLNKKEQNVRQQRSADINGDIIDNINGDSDSITIDPDLSNDDDGRENDGICLQDVVQLQLRLTQLENEKEQYKNKYEAIQKQIDDMISDVESTKQMNQQLKQEIEQAKEERLKAITELEVLSKYYKAKELEYAKDIGVHKIKQEQQNEDVESMSSKLEIVQEENSMLKEQLKSVKKELEDTERRLKSQLNQLEKQSHENWIAARAAERKYEECKAEASALRQTLSQSVKSPPPGELSSFIGLGGSFLDDTASSVSSLPEGVLNTSLQVPPPPPPPPPPFPFPSIFAPVIPPPPPSHQPPMVPPGGSSGGSALFDPHHHHNAETNPANNSTTYWSAPPPPFSAPSSVVPVPNLPPPAVPPSSISSTTYPYDLSKNSIPQPVSSTTDSTSMTFSQVNQTRQQPYGQQQAYNTSTPTTNNNPYNYGHLHQQQHESFHNSQLDLSRNTYSPAMSQRSTHTPLTNPSLSYDMQQRQQQPNPYGSITMHQQTTTLQQDPRFINTNANNNINTNNETNNPYSVNNNYPNVGYSQQKDQQQQQQPSSSHDVYSSPHHHVQQQIYPNTSMVGSQQQYQSQPQHSVIDTTNNSSNYPNYPNVQPHLMQQQSQPPPPTLQQSSQSRPQSVHNQMV